MMCGAHLFILPIDAQAGLEQVVVAGSNGSNFSQCPLHGEVFHRLEVQDIAEFDSG
jgi:hypothetical protein